MGTYVVNVNGCNVKVRVADHAETINKGISELRIKLRDSQSKIVGMSIYCRPYNFCLLQLCVDNNCIVVVLSSVSPLPQDLTDFLDDPLICFVGLKIDLHFSSGESYCSVYNHALLRGMDVRELAARILKKPNLLQKKLFKELASEVGISFDDHGSCAGLNALSSTIFTNEEVKCFVCCPHATYLIAKKLLNMLN